MQFEKHTLVSFSKTSFTSNSIDIVLKNSLMRAYFQNCTRNHSISITYTKMTVKLIKSRIVWFPCVQMAGGNLKGQIFSYHRLRNIQREKVPQISNIGLSWAKE